MRIFADALLRDKVVLVTGGGTGIGRSIALSMASYGAHLVLASRNLDHLCAVANEATAQGVKALPVRTDVRHPEAIETMLHTAIDTFGRIDVLVNNAAGSFLSSARKLTPKGWQAVVDTTLHGTFYCCQTIGRQMIQQGGGKIINITATLHFKGAPGLIAPSAAKAGVEALTKTLALEWAKFHILVNAIAPGPIYTPGANANLWSNPDFHDHVKRGVPLGRFGTPEDIAHMAILLASPAGDYITGATMVVDGGEWLKKGME
ncbi:MAG: SDR family oxidoreductase [Candidatus Tectomicrobia bacterium]|uniref:SDR family oxidoreductase n=1 Tax=Tectimicrobiota bacterium TaxID=2528274 RepID=A0A938B3L1_UNCTE|nr:SDR family oxidoreductase [Candidatus Tectomicrobia bacterium]